MTLEDSRELREGLLASAIRVGCLLWDAVVDPSLKRLVLCRDLFGMTAARTKQALRDAPWIGCAQGRKENV